MNYYVINTLFTKKTRCNSLITEGSQSFAQYVNSAFEFETTDINIAFRYRNVIANYIRDQGKAEVERV